MERRLYGNTGMPVSVLGFGGSEIGYDNTPLAQVKNLLDSALDAGLNVIDTAECYGTGEERLGQAVAGRRSQFYLFTKCGHASGMPYPDWDPKLIEASIDRSLERLKTDHVDIVHLHSCDEAALRKGDVIAALQKARDAGKTRFIGYSGDSSDARYAVTCGAFDSLQTSINIADQEAITLTLPGAIETGMGVTAKRPIANAAWIQGDLLSPGSYARPYWDRLKKLDYDFFKRQNADEVAATALRFTLSLPGVCTAIVGTVKPGRWQQNARYLEDGPLPEEEMQAIRRRWQEVAGADWQGQR